MNIMEFVAIRYNILLRKKLLNILLVIFKPTNKLIVLLSQNLDKYVSLYQKLLFFKYSYNNSSRKYLKDIAA